MYAATDRTIATRYFLVLPDQDFDCRSG